MSERPKIISFGAFKDRGVIQPASVEETAAAPSFMDQARTRIREILRNHPVTGYHKAEAVLEPFHITQEQKLDAATYLLSKYSPDAIPGLFQMSGPDDWKRAPADYAAMLYLLDERDEEQQAG